MSGRPHYEHGNSSITGNTTPSSNELPPLSHSSRSASFSNLLNPASQDDGSQRRRKAADMDSPPTSARPLAISKQRQGPEAPQSSADIQHRRILTPRSPSLHRATSMGQLGPAGTIDAQQTPFLNSPRARTYTAEPGLAGVPALPTPKAYPPLPSPPTLDRKPSTNTTSDSRARSTSVSPKTQHPHYFQSSPASALPSSSTGPYVDERQRPASIPISSASGQNVYQMYTLHTSAGAVPIPVDVQAASRVADEKRKRNAGASARFRARRKEKEKESTVTIDKLEEQVKHLSEQVEFYRRERGALANALMQYPGGDRHFPRPPSPRYRAVSITGPSRRASDDYSQDMSPGPADRNVRRRTSTQSLPMGAPPAPQYATQSQHYDHYHRQHPPLPGPAALLPPIHAQMTQPVSPHAHQAPPPSQSLQHASGWHSYNTGSRPNTQQGRPSDPHGR